MEQKLYTYSIEFLTSQLYKVNQQKMEKPEGQHYVQLYSKMIWIWQSLRSEHCYSLFAIQTEVCRRLCPRAAAAWKLKEACVLLKLRPLETVSERASERVGEWMEKIRMALFVSLLEKYAKRDTNAKPWPRLQYINYICICIRAKRH